MAPLPPLGARLQVEVASGHVQWVWLSCGRVGCGVKVGELDSTRWRSRIGPGIERMRDRTFPNKQACGEHFVRFYSGFVRRADGVVALRTAANFQYQEARGGGAAPALDAASAA